MKGRRAARRLAVDVLYEAAIRDELPLEAFDARTSEGWVVATADDDEGEEHEEPREDAISYARTLVEGVQMHQAATDELIARYADRWALQRMPVIDLTILRIAVFELLHAQDVPVAVAINEAVELGKELSTDDSGRFINGVLGKLAEEQLEPEPDDA